MAAEQTSWLVSNGVEVTDSSLKYDWHISPAVTVRALYEGKGVGAGFAESVNPIQQGTFGVILDRTSFYYESGGQIFDTGKLVFKNASGQDVDVEVINAQVYGGFVVHVCKSSDQSAEFAIRVGDAVECRVDYDRRSYIAPNHTMTHVLNYAIRSVLLGDAASENVSAKGSCDQKGSLVDAEKLRFDFSWNGALSADEVRSVEGIVSKIIQDRVPVFAKNVPLASASKICSLRSVFGERYPDPVRVLSVGVDVDELVAQPDNPQWRGSSVEFCGGTHLSNTSDAEVFVIIEECGIAKGIRRITGLTRAAAAQAKAVATELLERIESLKLMPAGPELNNLSKALKLEVTLDTVQINASRRRKR
jgi:alanyl-tRNA synthetase